MTYSSTANSVTPNKVTTISWTGLTFPRMAPKAIREPAQQKSALIMLHGTRKYDSKNVVSFLQLCNSVKADRRSLFNPNVDLSGGGIEGVEPALHEESPLQAEGGYQEVETHSSKAVAFQEGHEETKPNKDHDMDILEA